MGIIVVGICEVGLGVVNDVGVGVGIEVGIVVGARVVGTD